MRHSTMPPVAVCRGAAVHPEYTLGRMPSDLQVTLKNATCYLHVMPVPKDEWVAIGAGGVGGMAAWCMHGVPLRQLWWCG